MSRQRLISIAVAGALGAGSALGLAACGEDRGSLSIDGTSTGSTVGTTSTTSTTSTTPSTGTTSTTPTATPAQ